jgi:PhzF family phenazine biosynthesis protein
MDRIPKVEVQIINAFVDHEKGGNPAGVVLNADHLTNQQKLQIAAKVGLSETAFVSRSDIADFKLEFFTQTRQIAHCGHATIATFSYMSQRGWIDRAYTSKETIDGKRGILIQDNMAFMEQVPPRYTDLSFQKDFILASLGLDELDMLPGFPLSIVNTGNSFAIIPVLNDQVLEKIVPDHSMIAQISEAFDLIGYYVFSIQTGDAQIAATTRMFAPRYGIEEESGTGMAAGPLACYLYQKMGLQYDRFLIRQGCYMNPPSQSLIIVDLSIEDGNITRIMAGGKGVHMRSMVVELFIEDQGTPSCTRN